MKTTILVIEYLLNLTALFLILFILSSKKDARATFSWILTLIFLPGIGILAYILIGNPRLKRIIDIKLKRNFILTSSGKIKHFITNNTYCNLVFSITKLTPVTINNIKLLENAAIKYSKLAEDILNAKKYIFLEYYIFRNDDSGRFFLNLLTHKVKQGVKVYLLYDWVGSITLLGSKALKEFVQSGGKKAVFLSPLSFRTFSLANFRNHRKIAIVDGEICYTGGINIGNEYLGKYSGMPEWIDCHVRFTGSAVREMEKVFCEDWYFCVKEDLTFLFEKIEQFPSGYKKFFYSHVIPSGPDQNINFIYESLLAIFSKAEKYVTIITPYLVPDETIINVLKNISLLGIKVTIILPGKNTHIIVGAAGKSYYEELMEAGIELYETKYILHSKLILVDGKIVSIGTANMDNRSMKLNFEVNLLVYSEEFARYVGDLAIEYISISRKLDLEVVKSAPTYQKVFNGICRVFSPIL